jgi:hypothetical protein
MRSKPSCCQLTHNMGCGGPAVPHPASYAAGCSVVRIEMAKAHCRCDLLHRHRNRAVECQRISTVDQQEVICVGGLVVVSPPLSVCPVRLGVQIGWNLEWHITNASTTM